MSQLRRKYGTDKMSFLFFLDDCGFECLTDLSENSIKPHLYQHLIAGISIGGFSLYIIATSYLAIPVRKSLFPKSTIKKCINYLLVLYAKSDDSERRSTLFEYTAEYTVCTDTVLN